MLEIIDHGRIREIRLNRPPANAINNEMAQSMGEALIGAAENADAVIVSGRPGMFSAGLDVPELLTLKTPRLRSQAGRRRLTPSWAVPLGRSESSSAEIRLGSRRVSEAEEPPPDAQAERTRIAKTATTGSVRIPPLLSFNSKPWDCRVDDKTPGRASRVSSGTSRPGHLGSYELETPARLRAAFTRIMKLLGSKGFRM